MIKDAPYTDCFWAVKPAGEEKSPGDPVFPGHYKSGGMECVDFIKAALGKDGFQAFCLGNVMKYVWRHGSAGGAEDIRKAKRYLEYWLDAEGTEKSEERER